MRKITTKAIYAFMNHSKYSKDNTVVRLRDGYTAIYLNGNCIARHTPKGIEINHQDYLTNTTKERLNGIPGVCIQQKKGIWYLNNKEMLNGWNKI